jgi:hypothetical protein
MQKTQPQPYAKEDLQKEVCKKEDLQKNEVCKNEVCSKNDEVHKKMRYAKKPNPNPTPKVCKK